MSRRVRSELGPPPRPPWRRGIPFLIGCLLACGGAGGALRAEIPRPRLDGMEPAVARQLEKARQRLDELLTGPTPTREAQAAAFGYLGQLYLLNELGEAAAAALAKAAEMAPSDATWPYLLGYLHQTRGELAQARLRLREAAALEPEDLPTRLRLAQVNLADDRGAAARAVLEEALQRWPEEAVLHFELGRALAEEGEDTAAAAALETVLRLQPRASQANYPLALAYRRLGRIDEAREKLAQRGSGRPQFADPRLEVLPRLSEGASLHLVNAGVAFSQGRVADAIADYRRAIEADPESVRARRGLGQALASAGDPTGAVQAYREAAELAPDDAVVRYDLGTVLLHQGQAAAAEAELKEALELAPDLLSAHSNLASLYARQGRLPEALATLDALLAQAPKQREARLQRAQALRRLGRPAEALPELQALHEGDPGDPLVRLRLAETLVTVGRGSEAVPHFRAVSETADRPRLAARARLALGQQATSENDTLAALEEAVAKAPDLAETRLALGRALHQTGRSLEALIHLDRALELAPASGEAYLTAAQAALSVGRHRQARDRLLAGIAAAPGSGDLVHLLARFLATCPEDELRDGPQALELARRVFSAAPVADHAETLAMALAEQQRFDEAVAVQSRALQERTKLGDPEATRRSQTWLDLYRQQRPCRAPWKP